MITNQSRHYVLAIAMLSSSAFAQLIDQTRAPNLEGEGIKKSYVDQIGAGRGDWSTPDSSAFIISRDPFRAIRRGRQLFNRKFTKAQGLGPSVGDGQGDVNLTLAIGAGLSDSCTGCHGLPRGSAGFGGAVATRPDHRNAPHLFGLGYDFQRVKEIAPAAWDVPLDGAVTETRLYLSVRKL